MRDYVRIALIIVGILFILNAFRVLLVIVTPVQNPGIDLFVKSIGSAFISIVISAGIFVYLRHIK